MLHVMAEHQHGGARRRAPGMMLLRKKLQLRGCGPLPLPEILRYYSRSRQTIQIDAVAA